MKKLIYGAIVLLILSTTLQAERLWENMSIRLNSGEYIWATLDRDSNCYNISVGTNIRGNASNCSNDLNGYWSIRANGYLESSFHGDKSDVIKKIISMNNQPAAHNSSSESSGGFLGNILKGIALLAVAASVSSNSENNSESSSNTVSHTPSHLLLTDNDLLNKSKSELAIMRNDIFARHGYIFKTKKMRNYYKKQSWYTPRFNNVNNMLTDIDYKNIALIQKYERK